MDTNALVTIDYVIKSYLNRRGISSSADYDRYKQILIEGFTDLNLFHTTYYSEYIGTVNAVNQLTLPVDFVDWIKVSVEVNGQYWQLDYNENIVSEPSNTVSIPVFTNHLVSPPVVGNGYTRLRRNKMGEFKLNREKRVITFVGDLKDYSIYLNYVSSGIPLSGSVYIPRELVTVLRNYLDWQIKYNNDSVPVIKAQLAEQAYGDSLVQYYDSVEPFSMKELLNVFMINTQQGIKR